MDAAATAQVNQVLGLLGATLGDTLLGVYLHGSAVLGGLRPTSDLDLLAVARRRMTAPERRELIERLMAVSGPGDPTGRSRPLGVEVVAQADVRPWRYPGRLDVQYGDWFRPAFSAGDFAPWDVRNPDLAILLAMVLHASRPLFGPEPAELIGPVPWADVERAMLDSVPDLLRYLDGDERNVVLTFARCWATLETGQFLPKDAASDWAIDRLPPGLQPVMARARDLYLEGIATEDWGDLRPGIRPLVARLVAAIRAAAHAEGPGDRPPV